MIHRQWPQDYGVFTEWRDRKPQLLPLLPLLPLLALCPFRVLYSAILCWYPLPRIPRLRCLLPFSYLLARGELFTESLGVK